MGVGATSFAAGAVAFAASILGGAMAMPDRVPLHFDVHGDPDRWASRGEALLTIGIIGVAVAGLFGLIGVLVSRIPVGMVNVPDRDWWAENPEREAELRRRLRTDMLGLGGGVLVFFAVVTVLTTRASRTDPPHLDAWFFVALALFLGGVLGWVVYAVRVRYRRTDPTRLAR